MKKEFHPKRPDIFVSGKEMLSILNICGYSKSDFARALRKSPSYVNRILTQDKEFLPLDDLQALQTFVGLQNFTEARQQFASGVIQKTLPKYFLPLVLSICGKTNAEFARFLKRGPSFVYDLLQRLPPNASIPLRYIDALTDFVGKEYFEAAHEEVRRTQ